MLRVLAAVIAGLLLWASFPGLGIWPLAPLGLGVLAATAHRAGFWRGTALGLLAGLAFFLPLISWAGVFVGAVPWIALSTLQALFVALAMGAYGWVGRSGAAPGVRVLAFALLWTAAEVARSVVPFGGFPWGRIAFSQNASPLLGWAPLISSVGLGFVAALVGALLARAVLDLRRGVRAPVLLPVAGAAVLTVVPVFVPRPVDGETISVAAIQGNVPRAGLDFNAERRLVLDNHATLTEEVAAQIESGERDPVDLVLWPENSSDIDPLRNADAAEVIADAVDAAGVPIVVGAVLREPAPNISNASLVYAPGEGEVARYVKRHPVPFAEWIPYRDFFRMFSPYVDYVRNDFIAGEGSGAVDVPLQDGSSVRIGIGICFEVVYDDLLQETMRSGAQLLFIPTNNATFGYTDEAVQQLAASQVRAVEFGRSTVQVSTTGVSALITPDGTVHQPTGLYTREAIQGELPLRTDLTPAARLGQVPAFAVTGGAGLVLAVAVLGRLRSRGERRGTVVEADAAASTPTQPEGGDR